MKGVSRVQFAGNQPVDLRVGCSTPEVGSSESAKGRGIQGLPNRQGLFELRVHREVPGQMTNRCNQSRGGGRRPDLRMPGGWRGVWTLCCVLGLLVVALPAMAAEILEVRVGRHPEFTRVVFELDRAAGYRIERSDPSSDVQELVVSLDAASAPRHLKSSKSLIERVDVEPSGSRSVAKVRLSTTGLRLKEMILTNPARIVLDVMHEKPVAQPKSVARSNTPTTPTTPTTTPAKPTQTSDSGDRFVPASKPAESVREEKLLAEKPVVAKQTPPQQIVERQRIEEPVPAIDAAIDEVVQEEAEALFADDAQVARAGEPSTSVPVERLDGRDGLAGVPRDSGTPNVPADTSNSGARPMVAKTATPESDDGLGWTFWALVGGAVLLIGGGLFIARPQKGAEVSFEDDEDPFGDASDADSVVSRSGSNPFSGTGSEQTTATLFTKDKGGATVTPSAFGDDADEEKESESVVFGDSEETVMVDMEVISRDQVNESLGGGMPPMMGGAVPEEFQQMMTEMSRRLEALESRCDELVDARDRLERQVAAQTEELRVQRAAIARTQRAVRNLGRPEEGEQEATEPALRDPS